MKRILVFLALVLGCEYEGGLLGELNARPECSPGSLEFVAVEGTGTLAAKDLVLRNTGDEPARFALEDDANWLALSSYSATSDGPEDDATVQVTPDITGLSPGVYTATIRIRSGAWEKAVAVELFVALGGSNVIYVSIDGDDTDGDGSFEDPYRTVTKGVFELSGAKDTVYILPSEEAYNANESFPIALKDGTAVTAPSAEYVELRGDGANGVFTAPSVTSTLSGLTVSQGSAPAGGGLFVTGNTSSVTLSDCIFEYCAATGNGGAVRVEAGSVSFSRCVLRYNTAKEGGGVHDSTGTIAYDECVFEGNAAVDLGGGVGCGGGVFTKCVFSGNSAQSGTGGGCFISGAGTLQDCVFDSNNAGTNGGAVYAAGGALTADGLLLVSNSAGGAGGGIYVAGGGTIDNSMIDSNTAKDGAGIYATAASVDISTCGIVNNVASAKGGGVYFAAGGTVADTTVESNAAIDGAGIYGTSAAVTIGTSNIDNNIATGNGGGVFLSGGGTVFNNSIDSNAADVGGGIYVTSTRVAFGAITITNNTANVSGGGVAFDSATAGFASMFHDSDVSYNTAGSSGGGIYVAGGSDIAMGPLYIVGNSASSGGGIYVENGQLGSAGAQFFQNNLVALNQGDGIVFVAGTLDVLSCTVVDNVGIGLQDTSLVAGGLSVINSIFWGNGDDLDGVKNGDVSYCDIEDSDDLLDATVLHADPSFVDRAGEDYRLTGGSPCIDKGLNAASSWATDLDGNARIVNGTVDMGCYEYQ